MPLSKKKLIREDFIGNFMKMGHTGKKSIEILNAILKEIEICLAEGKRIELRGFGEFYCKARRRTGVILQTGKVITLPEMIQPKFRFFLTTIKIVENALKS